MRLKFKEQGIDAIQWQGNNFLQVVDFLKNTYINAQDLSGGIIYVDDTHVDTGFYIVKINENKVCFLSRDFVDNFCEKTDIFSVLEESGVKCEVTSPTTATLYYQEDITRIANILKSNHISDFTLKVHGDIINLFLD